MPCHPAGRRRGGKRDHGARQKTRRRRGRGVLKAFTLTPLQAVSTEVPGRLPFCDSSLASFQWFRVGSFPVVPDRLFQKGCRPVLSPATGEDFVQRRDFPIPSYVKFMFTISHWHLKSRLATQTYSFLSVT